MNERNFDGRFGDSIRNFVHVLLKNLVLRAAVSYRQGLIQWYSGLWQCWWLAILIFNKNISRCVFLTNKTTVKHSYDYWIKLLLRTTTCFGRKGSPSVFIQEYISKVLYYYMQVFRTTSHLCITRSKLSPVFTLLTVVADFFFSLLIPWLLSTFVLLTRFSYFSIHSTT